MTVTAMPGRPQAIRLRRPPLLEPSPDDGPGPAPTPPAGAALLPLDWPPAASARTTLAASRSGGPRPDPAAQAAATAQRYVQVCLEVLNGFRPVSHLRSLTGPVEFTAVVGQLARRRNAAGHFPALGAGATAPAPASSRRASGPHPTVPRSPSTPSAAGAAASAPDSNDRPSPRTGSAGGAVGAVGNAARPGAANALRPAPASSRESSRTNTARGAQPYRLQRLLMSEPRPGVAEVVAVLSHAGTSMAVAMRLELHDGRWQCVVVQII